MNIIEFTAAADAAFDRTLDRYVCLFCDIEVSNIAITCKSCQEYKGIIPMSEWEEINGEEWEG